MHGVAGDELIADLNAPAGGSDFYFVSAEDPETAVHRILELTGLVKKHSGLRGRFLPFGRSRPAICWRCS